ncbi:hypothetical protein T439DRAFT_375840 [Meredithblackwellia eburnea MCA 4105]
MSPTSTRVLCSSSKKNPFSTIPFPPEILSVIIKFSVEPVSADYGVSPRRYKRLLNFMHVARDWYQVAMPELYVLVHITSLRSMRALTRSLSNSAVSGRLQVLPAVRWLWVDFEMDLETFGGSVTPRSWDELEDEWTRMQFGVTSREPFTRNELPRLLEACKDLLHLRLDNYPKVSVQDLLKVSTLETLELGDFLPQGVEMDGKWMMDDPYPQWTDAFLTPTLFPNLHHLFWHRIGANDCDFRFQHKWSAISVGSLGGQLRSLSIGRLNGTLADCDAHEADLLLGPALRTCTSLEKLELFYPVKIEHFLRNIPSKIKQLLLPWHVRYDEIDSDSLSAVLLPCLQQDPTSLSNLEELIISKIEFEEWKGPRWADRPYHLTEEGQEDLRTGRIMEPSKEQMDEWVENSPYLVWTEEEFQLNFKELRRELRDWCERRKVKLVETEECPTGKEENIEC